MNSIRDIGELDSEDDAKFLEDGPEMLGAALDQIEQQRTVSDEMVKERCFSHTRSMYSRIASKHARSTLAYLTMRLR